MAVTKQNILEILDGWILEKCELVAAEIFFKHSYTSFLP